MNVRKVATTLHSILGLVSGIIVFIVCLTGAVWALNIHGWVDPDERAETVIQGNSDGWLPPSSLVRLANDSLGFTPTYLTYYTNGPVLVAKYTFPRETVYLNPYTGSVIGKRADSKKPKYTIWQWAREGHRHLWLPRPIGSMLVNYGTLIFVIVLLTGVISWWPKKIKYLFKQSRIKWKRSTSMKKIQTDIHTIFGFYITPILLLCGFTGMVWGISWWSDGLYMLTNNGKKPIGYYAAQSDTTNLNANDPNKAADTIFYNAVKEYGDAVSIGIGLADSTDKTSVISLSVQHEKNMYYNSDRYSFDRYTLKRIKTGGPYDGKYDELSWGDKLRRMNYELHIGSRFGLFGRILIFLVAIIGTCLPLTGFYLYYKKRVKRKRKSAHSL